MKSKLKAVAISDPGSQSRRLKLMPVTPLRPRRTNASKKPPKPTVEEQINALRQEFQTQIDSSEIGTGHKGCAVEAGAADSGRCAGCSLKGTGGCIRPATGKHRKRCRGYHPAGVRDGYEDGQRGGGFFPDSDDAAAIKKSINSPAVLHYKGVTLAPGGYLAAETVWRSKATGGDIPTAFNAIPYEHCRRLLSQRILWQRTSIAYKPDGGGQGQAGAHCAATTRLTGWAPASLRTTTSPTAMCCASASSGARQRRTTIGPSPAVRCGHSQRKTRRALSNLSGDIMTPQTIDPNYVVGFVWTRQWGFRVTKTGKVVCIRRRS